MAATADWILVALVGILLLIEVTKMAHSEHPFEFHDPHHPDKCPCKSELAQIEIVLKQIRAILRQILALAEHPLPTGGTLTKIGDDEMPTNNSIVAGTSGIFQVTPTPAGSAVPAADIIAFAADNPAVVISSSPDADPTKAMVAVPAGSTFTSFNLACQFSGPDFPTPVNATPISVAVTQPTAPLPTGGTIAQLS